MQLDAVIFGGGVAGLWLLDELVRRGCAVLLLESGELGGGQTVASQGIIHGGLKYTLKGLLTRSAASIREMPDVWRDCLAGRRVPDLTDTPVRSEFCYLWRTESLRSRLGMIGAKAGLRVAPKELCRDERPAVLAECPGTVARLDEQVISPAHLVANLAAPHRGRILKIDAGRGTAFETAGPGQVTAIRLTDPVSGKSIELRPLHVIFAAGAGNAELRRRVGLAAEAMQRRPLHMVMLRGDLPRLNGHCVDGAKTRVTITSDVDSSGRTVWQVGGQLSEEGVGLDGPDLIARARSELQAVIPGLDLSQVEWATYRIDRAEGRTKSGKRPETVQVLREGNTITAWPTKLALAPILTQQIADPIEPKTPGADFDSEWLSGWPSPTVAPPPWETRRQWHRDANHFVSNHFVLKKTSAGHDSEMQRRPLGRTGLQVTPIGFGSFKIGRNQKTKYPEQYALPDDAAAGSILNGVLDLGVTYIDTAPAYGLSEERIGRAIGHRRSEFVLSTKVGETFEDGRSTYDFSESTIRASIQRSLKRLRTDALDLVFIHSDGDDLRILNETDAVATLESLKTAGLVRAIGLSGKTVEGARQALDWADAIMVEYHLADRSHEAVIAEAAERGIGVVVKKGLAAGRLSAGEAIRFVLANPHVTSMVVGGLSLDHLRANIAVAPASFSISATTRSSSFARFAGPVSLKTSASDR